MGIRTPRRKSHLLSRRRRLAGPARKRSFRLYARSEDVDELQKAIAAIKPYHAPKRSKWNRKVNGLLTDLYELTMAAGYFAAGKSARYGTFEFTIRRLPRHRDFVVVAGLHRAVDYLLNLSFTAEEIDYLRGLPQFRNAPRRILGLPRRFPLHRRCLRRTRRHRALRRRAAAERSRAAHRRPDPRNLPALRHHL